MITLLAQVTCSTRCSAGPSSCSRSSDGQVAATTTQGDAPARDRSAPLCGAQLYAPDGGSRRPGTRSAAAIVTATMTIPSHAPA